jgi:hypothetical protein
MKGNTCNLNNLFQSNRLYSRDVFKVIQLQETPVYSGGHRLSLTKHNCHDFMNFHPHHIWNSSCSSLPGQRLGILRSIHMHLFVLWPVLALGAAAVAGAATIEDSFHRSVVYWLVLPALLMGALAAVRI